MSKSFSEIIEACISEFLKVECFYNFAEGKIDVCKIAEENHFLPVLHDWTLFCSLRPNGEFVWYDLDNHNISKIETNRRIQNIAMVKGIERFSELQPFLPKRSIEDIDCPYCESTNQLPKEIRKSITCYCGELGWIPKNGL